MAVKPVPDGYHTVTPYLIVDDAKSALDFYKKALGAEEIMRFEMGGKIGHAEIKIGNSPIMLADEHPQMGHKSAKSYGGTPVSLVLYLPDVDAAAKRATDAGMKVLRPVTDQFYGDRAGTFADPFGHVWTLTTHKEDVPPAEMQKRMKDFAQKQGAK